MAIRIGMGTAYYGSADYRHLECVRGARNLGAKAMFLNGSAYPEVSRAEILRHALAAEAECVVIIDAGVTFEPPDVVRIAETALARNAIVTGARPDVRSVEPWSPSVFPRAGFCAVPLSAVRQMSRLESREYTNTTVIETAISKDSRPFFSPWKKAPGTLDTPPVSDGIYADPDSAFFARAREAGIEVVHTPSSAKRLGGTSSEVVVRPGDAKKRAEENVPNFPICVPRFGATDIEQESLVRILNESFGCTVIELFNCPHIDLARSELVRVALEECGADGVFFLDHDIIFDPNDALCLMEEATERRDVVAAVYNMRKTAHALIGAIDVPMGTKVGFFGSGKIYPGLYSGMGFCAIPRCVFEALDKRLPLLRSYFGFVRPYFALDTNGNFYSGEDVSFCARVQGLAVKTVPGSGNENGHDWELSRDGRGAGHRVWLDTRIRIFHKGAYHYGIEDHSIAVPRFGHLDAELCATREAARAFNFRADEVSASVKNRTQGIDVGATRPHGTLPESLPG